MFGRVMIAGVVVGALLFVPRMAVAGEWPWPVDGRVGLAYADPWTDAAGKRCSHGGLDVEAPAGARVSACVGGRVAFAGRVPAAGGGTAFAVSVVTPDGMRVTYLPLAACSVVAGVEMAAGERIGELAESGDGSLATPHLHLSVRRGEAPIDPATLLGVSAPSGASGPSAAAGSGGAPSGVVAPGVPADAGSAVARSGPVAAHAPGSVVTAPTATGVLVDGGSIGQAAPRAPAGLGPRIDARIRSLPYEPRFDAREALARAGAVASAGRGLAIRVLLALLAALLLARIARGASRVTTGGSAFAPVPAHARRARG